MTTTSKIAELLTNKHCQIMGIVNITSDSYCSIGRFQDVGEAVDYALSLTEQGADLIDVGAEATNPAKSDLDQFADNELTYISQFLKAFTRQSSTPVSIDTSNCQLIERAADLGAQMINDVRALRRPGALEAAASSGLHVCLMHMLYPDGLPQYCTTRPYPQGLLATIKGFLVERITACIEAGIPRHHLAIDPGIGGGAFGKSPTDDLSIISNVETFTELDLPVCIGLSRKSFLGKIFDLSMEERLIPSIVLATIAAQKGAQILRVHDVAPTRTALSYVAHQARKPHNEALQEN